MCLFADRLSTDEMMGNYLRLYFSALTYTLMGALLRLALKGTGWAEAQAAELICCARQLVPHRPRNRPGGADLLPKIRTQLTTKL